MKSTGATPPNNPPAKYLAIAALAIAMATSAQAVDKNATSSGVWTDIVWNPAGLPTSSDFANIGDGYSVQYTSAATTVVGRLYLGSDVGVTTSVGSLSVSAGILSANASNALAAAIGFSTGSNGTLLVNGGTFRTSGAGGFLNVGAGVNSTGSVTLSSGSIAVQGTSGSVVLGGAVGSSGTMLVSNGNLSIGLDLQVGRRVAGTSTGSYTQTNGATTMAGAFRVGYAGTDQTINATALITGGSFSVAGNMSVGRQTGFNGAGTSKLTWGNNVTFTGGAATSMQVSGNGELALKLGATNSFSAIDLSLSSSSSVFQFTELGAKLTIDGTSLIYDESYTAITLLKYGLGKGPTAASISNITPGISFVGFDAGYTPSLTWGDTGLVLNLSAVPEPSTFALMAMAGVGLVAIRRRRR